MSDFIITMTPQEAKRVLEKLDPEQLRVVTEFTHAYLAEVHPTFRRLAIEGLCGLLGVPKNV